MAYLVLGLSYLLEVPWCTASVVYVVGLLGPKRLENVNFELIYRLRFQTVAF